jgi:dTDP-4-dehydrorhamnose 3,5-epimerase
MNNMSTNKQGKEIVIDGVKVFPLKQICDDRGKICHMMKRTDAFFEEFGEIYFSFIYPGIIKAWHLHDKMALNYCVPVGMIKLVLYDDRPNSTTKGIFSELFIGESNYCIVHIPPRVWNGFKCLGNTTAMVANCATLPHDPDEIKRMDVDKAYFTYSWETKMC